MGVREYASQAVGYCSFHEGAIFWSLPLLYGQLPLVNFITSACPTLQRSKNPWSTLAEDTSVILARVMWIEQLIIYPKHLALGLPHVLKQFGKAPWLSMHHINWPGCHARPCGSVFIVHCKIFLSCKEDHQGWLCRFFRANTKFLIRQLKLIRRRRRRYNIH